MKLRSGKILDYAVSVLPIKLKEELDIRITKFKQLFGKNPEHAQELLKIIIDASGIDHRFLVTSKIITEYSKTDHISEMLRTAGALMLLIIGDSDFYDDNHIQPIYHDDIEAVLSGVTLE